MDDADGAGAGADPIEGFGDALDGYYDAAGQLRRYLRERAADCADPGAGLGDVESPAAAAEHSEHVRERLVASMGGLPEAPTNPPVEHRGRVDSNGYAVERLVIESHPGFRMPANCYVPDGEGPFPAVLLLAGHVDDPRVDAENQATCARLAENGVVVLLADPICQGERRQNHDDGEPLFGGDGGVFGHCLAGQRCFYAGANVGRYMIHDDRCALAHLLARDDVDAERVGVTGTSGGGLRTLYLAVLDDQPAAFAPTCAVTTRGEWRRTGKRIDAEQVIHGAVPDGVGYEDLLVAAAPTPTFVGAAASDQYFPVEGAREAVVRARRSFAAHDAGDALTLRVVDDRHTSVAGFGPEVYEFLCERLGAGPYDPVPEPEPLDADRLRCTSPGNVLAAFDDERTVEQLLWAYVAERYPDAAGLGGDGERLGTDPDDVDPASVREAVVETLDLDREGASLHPRVTSETEAGDLRVERVWFRTERDPDAVVAGVLVVADEAPTAPAVICYEDGTAALPERSADLVALAREHGAALAFDPRGVGAVRNRPIPIPPWVDDYHGIYGTEFKLAYDALLLGTSLLGLRTYDVVRAVEFLRAETGAETASLVGEGTGAVHALYAAAATDDVTAVTAREPGRSFAARATDDQRRFDPALTAFGLVGDADLPRVVAALEARGVALSVSRA